jgi:uncharacterized membrane protein HdeD (DUF308 family)
VTTAPTDVANGSAGAGAVPEVEIDAAGPERLWYLFAISGVVSVVIGILVLAYPDPSIKLLGVFLGIDLLIVGGVLIVRGVARDADADTASGGLLIGTLALIAGLIVIRNPGESVALLAIAFAIYLVVAGAVAVGHGLVQRERRWVTLGRGIVLVTLGTVIICWPDISLTTLAVLAGIALVLQGAVEIAEAFVLRSLSRASAAG